MMFQYRCVLCTSQELQDVKNAENGIFAACHVIGRALGTVTMD